MSFGIYSIRNKTTGKVYIGSTLRDFNLRWLEHKSFLRRNKHGNPHLQNAWNKHGEDVFEFKVVEIINNAAAVIEAEQFYLDVFYGNMCYNIRTIAENNKGMKRSNATKEKHSKTMKERHGKGSKIAIERSNRMKGIPQPEKANVARQMKIKCWAGFISPTGVEYRNIEDLVSFAKDHHILPECLRKVGRNERNACKGWRIVKS